MRCEFIADVSYIHGIVQVRGIPSLSYIQRYKVLFIYPENFAKIYRDGKGACMCVQPSTFLVPRKQSLPRTRPYAEWTL